MVTTTRGKKKTAKRERVSFNASRARLQVELREDLAKGYVPRWFNDQDDRVERARAAGWEFTKRDEIAGRVGDKEVHGDSSDLNDRVSKVVGKDEAGPIRAYLMKIPREFWDEDRAEKAAKADLVDEAIRAGKSGGASIANQYGNVNMTRRR